MVRWDPEHAARLSKTYPSFGSARQAIDVAYAAGRLTRITAWNANGGVAYHLGDSLPLGTQIDPSQAHDDFNFWIDPWGKLYLSSYYDHAFVLGMLELRGEVEPGKYQHPPGWIRISTQPGCLPRIYGHETQPELTQSQFDVLFDLGRWSDDRRWGGYILNVVLPRYTENPYPPPEPERIYLTNPRKKLTAVLPLGKYEGMRVRLGIVRDPKWRGPTKPITCSGDAYAAVKTLGVEPVETMYVLLVDTTHRVIGIHEAARGGGRSIAVEPAALLQAAVATGAHAIILVHNHPSGVPEPSPEDIEMTRRMSEACKILGISLLDHLVVGESSYVSLADRELI